MGVSGYEPSPGPTAVPSPSHRPAMGPSLSREGRGRRSVSNDRDTETQNSG